MKKKLALLVCVAMSLTMLSGCGGQGAQKGADDAVDQAVTGSSDAGQTVKEEKPQAAAKAEGTDASETAEKENTEESKPDGVEDGIFTVGFDAEFPPYGYMDENGEYVGFDLSLAEEVCNRAGWTLKKQPIDWDAKDMELSSGAIDCIWNGFTINGREDAYTWTVPYVDNSQVFVVAADSGIVSQADLAGKAVAVQADSSALAALEDEENAALKDSFGSLNQFADYNTAFMDLEAGAIDCVAMDIGVADYQISSRGDGKFVILDDYLSTEQYGVGFLKGNESLRDKVQKILFEMLDDGTFEKIAKDWGLEETICLSK